MYEPRQGRKIFVQSLFLSPRWGLALISGLTPGLRPGLFSLRPSGAGWWAERVSRQKPAIGANKS